MATRKHLLAVNRAIRASNLDELGIDAPLAELLRDLARLIDRAGEDGPSSKLLSAYLSATKDLRRATSPRSARSRAATAATDADDDPESPAALKLVEESPLDKIRRNKTARPAKSVYDEVVHADAKKYGKQVGTTEPRLLTKPLRSSPRDLAWILSNRIRFSSSWHHFVPWQRALLIRALELNEDGTYRFRKIFVIVGRQNGKTTLLTVLALWWLFVDADSFPEHLPANEFLILGTAQNLDIAEEAWDAALKRCDPTAEEDDQAYVIDWLADETRKPVKTNGKKSLRLRNNAKYEPRAASRMGGRGKSAARVIMDEMREQQTWDVWGSVSKTKNAIFNSQLWGISSAGDVKSIVLQTLRNGAIRTIREFAAYVETGIQTIEEFANTHDLATALFEWSAPEKCKLLDIDAILQANPSVGYKPMFFDSIWSDLLGDEPEHTKRTEILCDWVTSREEPFLDGEAWSACADSAVLDDAGNVIEVGSQIADGARSVLGIAVSGNRSMSFIGVAGNATMVLAMLS